MKETLRENKGVTLVSLVVTIIILIILASISLNIVIGKDGIITVAQRAKENIELAQIEEGKRLNQLYEQMNSYGTSEGTEYDAIAKLAEYKEKVAAAITEKGVPTEKTDSTQTMAENIAKIGGTGGTETTKPIEELKAGDTVKYQTGKSDIGENGIITCKVLYPSDSEYGLQLIYTKGCLQVSLGGDSWETAKNNWNNHVELANQQAQNYINPELVSDARAFGTDPTIVDGKFVNKNIDGASKYTLPDNWTIPSGWANRNTDLFVGGNSYVKDGAQVVKVGNIIDWNNGIMALCCRAGAAAYSSVDSEIILSAEEKIASNTSYNSYTTNIKISISGSVKIPSEYKRYFYPCFKVKAEGTCLVTDEDGTYRLSVR